MFGKEMFHQIDRVVDGIIGYLKHLAQDEVAGGGIRRGARVFIVDDVQPIQLLPVQLPHNVGGQSGKKRRKAEIDTISRL